MAAKEGGEWKRNEREGKHEPDQDIQSVLTCLSGEFGGCWTLSEERCRTRNEKEILGVEKEHCQ
jgi:hypothetical protein